MSSVESFLEQVARRGSWFGGGSVAALGTALSAALLEKLVVQPRLRRILQRRRRACLRLISEDAATFARAIRASRAKQPAGFRRALQEATAVQARVARHANAIERACRMAQRRVAPSLQSDLRCAKVLAQASRSSAEILMATNRAWLRRIRARR